MSKKVIASAQAPKALGPYSQGIRVGNMIYLAGQIPLDPTSGQLVEGGILEQTERVISSIKALLESEGLSLNHVVKSTVFMKDLAEFEGMNQVYSKYFTEKPPARSTIQVARLPRDSKVEIEVVAIDGAA
ncbi:MAG: RidA family protein [Verrucomicrobiota bacterium]